MVFGRFTFIVYYQTAAVAQSSEEKEMIFSVDLIVGSRFFDKSNIWLDIVECLFRMSKGLGLLCKPRPTPYLPTTAQPPLPATKFFTRASLYIFLIFFWLK